MDKLRNKAILIATCASLALLGACFPDFAPVLVVVVKAIAPLIGM